MSSDVPPLAYKIAVLVFVENTQGEQLLLLRRKAPNLGSWSPLGGKLETGLGESPFECAVRETEEEAGLTLSPTELHLFAMIAEKAYEGESHWLLFLFRCLPGRPRIKIAGPGRRCQQTRAAFQQRLLRSPLNLSFPAKNRLPLPTKDCQAPINAVARGAH
jgi:ADP-ribose pyrophosphatase YjhB (NUDIX family)